ncbi:MAG: class I SAM-dependent methyltransferase [Capsulimonadales bacterium]|nr:class I SAM-dependent methyltransferase [Capsulimonadales bacterium]
MRKSARRYNTVGMVNYFDSARSAELYERGRPFYHDEALKAVAEAEGWTRPVANALDVGCGTGLSTRALLPYARRIIGLDASPAMIARAPADPRIRYRVAPAERLPLVSERIDLLTLSEAFHWLDQPRFLEEAHRVIRPGAWFLVYGGGIRGVMDEVPEFTPWMREVHLARYPEPPRHPPFEPENGPPFGFEPVREGRYEKAVPMTAERLADFFLSVSNTLQYLGDSGESPETHRQFLVRELLAFYGGRPDRIRHLRFGGRFHLLRRV